MTSAVRSRNVNVQSFLQTVKIKIVFSLLFSLLIFTKKSLYFVGKHIRKTCYQLTYFTEEAELFPIVSRHPDSSAMFQYVDTILHKKKQVTNLHILQRKGNCFLQSAVIQTDLPCFSMYTQFFQSWRLSSTKYMYIRYENFRFHCHKHNNPYLPSDVFHPCILDESIPNLRCVLCVCFFFLFFCCFFLFFFSSLFYFN